MSRSSLSFDAAFLYAASAGPLMISSQTVQETQSQVDGALTAVNDRRDDGQYDFIEELRSRSYLKRIQAVAEEISWADTVVVIGIGGSDLGARAIQEALQDQPKMNVIFAGDTPDPDDLRRVWDQISLETTVFNIVSKSGQTVEVVSQYAYWKQQVRHQTDQWQRHFVFTTDQENGVLRAEADQYDVTTLPIPAGVGGRFSVLTPVGLFPAFLMGVDIQSLVDGALQLADESDQRHQAEAFAASQFQLYHQGTKLVAMMPYSSRLNEFARWFRQLWAESLGKQDKGILPIQARGPADQHSQAQFYNQGSPLLSVLFLRINQRSESFTLSEVDIEAVQYLQGHDFQHILNVEQEATALALFKAGRPSGTMALDRLDAYSLGQLFMFFELAVVYVAEMLAVNAFDQPGVEEGKQLMYALLGRDGFDHKRAEIEQLKQRSV